MLNLPQTLIQATPEIIILINLKLNMLKYCDIFNSQLTFLFSSVHINLMNINFKKKARNYLKLH